MSAPIVDWERIEEVLGTLPTPHDRLLYLRGVSDGATLAAHNTIAEVNAQHAKMTSLIISAMRGIR